MLERLRTGQRWKLIRKYIVRVKVYVMRVATWYAPFAYLSIIYLALEKLGLSKYLLLIMLSVPILGYLEDKSGLFREEMELNAERMGLKKEESC